MESIELAMKLPFEKVDVGKDTEREKQRRASINRELYAQQVLDPRRCQGAMDEFDLAHVRGITTFVRKLEGVNLPIHMELNNWAKHELTLFCEAFIEEYEEVLTEIVMAIDDLQALNLTRPVCWEKLWLCQPAEPEKAQPKGPLPEPGPAGAGLDSYEDRMKKAKAAFRLMDLDGDGVITRHEAIERVRAYAEALVDNSPQALDEQLEAFFSSADKNGDGWVRFEEYQTLWQELKPPKVPEGSNRTGFVAAGWLVGAADLFEDLTHFVRIQLRNELGDYALVGGLSATCAALGFSVVLTLRSR